MSDADAPLLESKLQAPRRRQGLVRRARLDRHIRHGSLPPVVLVSAPAGFGKTTLVSEWLWNDEAGPERTAWLSLDRRDSDPSRFWSYVIAAVRKVAPEVGSDALTTLQSTPAALEHVVATLLNDLGALDGELVLVLDDYHVVESMDVHESMLFLVEHLPRQLHLVVASRADPPWPLAGRRARGELVEVRAADLRFTGEETVTYLNEAMGLRLSASDIDALEARTEGWIAALQLAALSLKDREDPGAFIAGFAGDDRFVVDYLVDEVLSRQPDDIRAFLLETSILSRLTGPLCAAVTGRRDARGTLETLERSNLFLVALDDRRQWYRYHHLFGDVLRARLTYEHPDRVAELHRRARDWFEADGDRTEAIRHALLASEPARAAELVELAIPALRQARQEVTLRGWLEALPSEVFDTRPLLTLGLVGARMGSGDSEGVEELLDSIEGWLAPDRPKESMVVHDQAEARRLPAQAAMYRAGLALLRGDLPSTIAHGQRAADLSGPDDHLGRGAAAALIGLARWADADLEGAARQYAAAIAEFEAAEYFADILGCSLGLADMQTGQGHLRAAERTLSAGLELAAARGPLRGTADMHVGLAEIHIERNELDAAAAHLRASQELGERLALPQYAHRWRVVDARLRSAQGDHAGAIELLREAERRYDTDYSPKARPVSATTARVRLTGGDLDGAVRWADESGLSADDDPDYLREYEHLTFARVLLATGRAIDAVPLLERVLGAAEAGQRTGNAIEAQLLLALAHDAAGDKGRALDMLGDALIRAEPEHFVRIFLDNGPPMRALLEAAARQGRAASQASALLASLVVPTSAPPQGLVDELSRRELEVLQLLRSDLTGPEIAAELVVSINTVRSHTKSIFMKLGVTSRRAAVRRAEELGL
jgi:LuxR family maltose regulon positive regulatory protein